MSDPSSVRVTLTPLGDDTYGLRLTLANATAAPITLATYEPFLRLTVQATAGASALEVTQPPIDIGIRKKSVTVPAHGELELATPIKLHFGSPPATDRFTWSIAHAPAGVALTVTLGLPAPFDRPAAAKL